jgi:hypothetical protein
MNTNDYDYERIAKELKTLKHFNDEHPRTNRTRRIDELQKQLSELRKI